MSSTVCTFCTLAVTISPTHHFRVRMSFRGTCGCHGRSMGLPPPYNTSPLLSGRKPLSERSGELEDQKPYRTGIPMHSTATHASRGMLKVGELAHIRCFLCPFVGRAPFCSSVNFNWPSEVVLSCSHAHEQRNRRWARMLANSPGAFKPSRFLETTELHKGEQESVSTYMHNSWLP